jgi:CHAT domain-containing protein
LKFKRIVIIADGVLQYLPFAALPAPGNAARPLLLDHEVINLPSASVLAVQRQQLGNRELPTLGLAVFADPVFDRNDERVARAGKLNFLHTAANRNTNVGKDETGEASQALRDVGLEVNGRIPRLSFSRVEADAILAVTQSLHPLGALDFDASRKRATTENLSRYRYLHFATHGILNSEHPEFSGLLFSMVDEQGKPQNGFLKLVEIYNLNLKADLVVLSACQTALGEEVKGEGLIGLTRGFMNAGARRVVASLWRVDDAATAELMSVFYREMFVNSKSPAAALRSAQIHISEQKRWRSPYYWAAFTIQGDWN